MQGKAAMAVSFLLDTNVVSETFRARPERLVLGWLEAQTPLGLFLAAQTLGELVRGARKAADRIRRERLENWIQCDLAGQFEGRILPFDDSAARIWGRLMGDGDRSGRTPSAADAQIAAVAIRHDLTLVTRNVKDFRHFEIMLLNPWRAGP